MDVSTTQVLSLGEQIQKNWIAFLILLIFISVIIIIMWRIFNVLITRFNNYLKEDAQKREADLKERQGLREEIRNELKKFNEGFIYFTSNREKFEFILKHFSIFSKIVDIMSNGGSSITDEFEKVLEDYAFRLKKNYGNGSSKEKAINTINYGLYHLTEYINDTNISDDLKPKFILLAEFIANKLKDMLNELDTITNRVQKPLLIDGNILFLKSIVNYFNILLPSIKNSEENWQEKLIEILNSKYDKYFQDKNLEKKENSDIDLNKEFGVHID